MQITETGLMADGTKVYNISQKDDPPLIYFSKTRDVKSPNRAHPTDAGIDFFLPNQFTQNDIKHSKEVTKSYISLTDDGKIVIPSFESILISSGTKWIVPENWAMIFFNKSGVASKKHLTVGACVVDSDYRGEVHINLINTSCHEVVIAPGEKIAQAVLLPIGNHTPFEVDDIMKFSPPTERGEGGFGSSGVQ